MTPTLHFIIISSRYLTSLFAQEAELESLGLNNKALQSALSKAKQEVLQLQHQLSSLSSTPSSSSSQLKPLSFSQSQSHPSAKRDQIVGITPPSPSWLSYSVKGAERLAPRRQSGEIAVFSLFCFVYSSVDCSGKR